MVEYFGYLEVSYISIMLICLIKKIVNRPGKKIYLVEEFLEIFIPLILSTIIRIVFRSNSLSNSRSRKYFLNFNLTPSTPTFFTVSLRVKNFYFPLSVLNF